VISPFSITNTGLSIILRIVPDPAFDETAEDLDGRIVQGALQTTVHNNADDVWEVFTIYLKPITGVSSCIDGRTTRAYRRVRCDEWAAASKKDVQRVSYTSYLVLEDEQMALTWQLRPDVRSSQMGDASARKRLKTNDSSTIR
jgi:hypothetical protein